MKTKVCSKCKKEKERKEFSLDRRQKHELYFKCKSCVKAHYEANKEKIAERIKAYRENNKEKIAERKKAYNEANKEKIAERSKAYHEANKEKIAERKKAYKQSNKEKIAAQNKAYREDNKEKIAAYREDNKEKLAAYYRARRKSDLIYNLSCRCRGRIRAAIRAKGFKKTTKTAEMLGCDWEFLKSHIESQFTEGMSWENREKWHIDHIIPLASASSEDDVIKLSHFSNLQPLWAEENLKKANKIIGCQPELTLKH